MTKATAARELLKRRSIRGNLSEWAKATGNDPAPHHLLLIDHLQRLTRREFRRLFVFMPPGSAKSTYGSVLFGPWFLAQEQGGPVIQASHSVQLAERFSRKVRNLVVEHSSTLGYNVADDNGAAGRWETSHGHEYYAAGVGTGIAGFRAQLGIIDDPVASREDADSERMRDRAWDWYNDDFSNRLKPGASELIIMCMTGDTPVLMADGTEKCLRDVRPGNLVATYEDGRISSAYVRNWINHGPDRVFKIRTKSGIIVKANARHPFLVEQENGEIVWQRTATLSAGTIILRVITENGETFSAPTPSATSRLCVKGCARRTTISTDGARACAPPLSTIPLIARHTCAIVTELVRTITNAFLPNKVAPVRFAGSQRATQSLRDTGGRSSVLITATAGGAYEDSCVTAATLSSAEGTRLKYSEPPLSTLRIIRDTVEDVTDGGTEDVFDIEVERTENFIANGLVSHNTRWHEDDLAGRLIARDGLDGPISTRILLLPAQAGEEDPLGREPGAWLWEGEYGYAARLREKKETSDPRSWAAMFQQNPVPDEGLFLDVGAIKRVTPPKVEKMRIFAASDYATSDGSGDYTVHIVGGLDENDTLHVLDVWRRQTTTDVWIEQMLGMAGSWKPLEWGEEGGVIIKAVSPQIERRMSTDGKGKAWVHRKQYPAIRDKPTRARPLQARIAQGNLAISPDAYWADELISELSRFPAGKHDDQVDALALLSVVAATRGPPKKVKPETDEDAGAPGGFWGS